MFGAMQQPILMSGAMQQPIDPQQYAAQCEFLEAEAKLTAQLQGMPFVNTYNGHIYNPLIYATNPHTDFVNKYFGPKKVLFLGMNPGPYGMAQNGVPFGDGQYVREWMGIQGDLVGPYPTQHPKHQILGLDCTKSEGSGSRFWEYMMKGPRIIEGSGSRKGEFDTMKDFFCHAYVHNYCPLLFLSPDGKNVTLDKLASTDQTALEMFCDEALWSCINIMEPEIVIAMGRYVETKVNNVLDKAVSAGGTGADLARKIEVVYMLHPSPATAKSYGTFQTEVSEQLVNVLPRMKQPPYY